MHGFKTGKLSPTLKDKLQFGHKPEIKNHLEEGTFSAIFNQLRNCKIYSRVNWFLLDYIPHPTPQKESTMGNLDKYMESET